MRRLGPERANVESQAVEELIELCGRLPLALAIVSARAAANPHSRSVTNNNWYAEHCVVGREHQPPSRARHCWKKVPEPVALAALRGSE